MFRFAWAYQGSGAVTYLAGGTTIDVRADTSKLDVKTGGTVDISSGLTGIDIISTEKVLDVSNDRNSIDL
jgi:Ethanolamine utilization protein EutJ (predicted chaperonin)